MAEAAPEVRLELVDGVIVAASRRATPWHAVMTGAIGGWLRGHVERPCRVAAESLAVGIAPDDPTYVHPDVALLCGPNEVHPEDETVVMNPRVVVEVLSPSTERRDWDDKLPKYKRIPSLHTILYVAHARRQVTAFLRTKDGWLEVVRETGSLRLPALGAELPVDDLYDEGLDDGGP